MSSINDIYKEKVEFWKSQNISFFGIEPRDWKKMNLLAINQFLAEDFKKYWENEESRCELFNLMLSGKILKDGDKIEYYSIEMNIISECAEIYAHFTYKDKKYKRLAVVFPLPHENLSWIINRTLYVPRIVCTRDFQFLNVDENRNHIVKQGRVWEFNTITEEFEILNPYKGLESPYNNLSNKNKMYLESLIHETLTESNFKDALKKVRLTHHMSVLNHNYYHIDHFFDLVRETYLFANPFKNIPFGINSLFLKGNKSANNDNYNLVITKSKLFSLEAFNTVVYQGSKYDKFSFADSKLYFDAFS